MKVRVLGCSGAIAQGCRTTSFLIDDDLLVDAGTGVGDLTLDEMRLVDDVVLTHAHLDHVAALPLMIDSVAAMRQAPLRVHALPQTIVSLERHIFNNNIWPDFTQIPSAQSPFVRFYPIETGQVLSIGGKLIEVLPAVHTVPAVGYAIAGIDSDKGAWVFTGDTERNPAFWRRLNQMHVAMLVIETAFSNREKHIARLSLHLSPNVLAEELDNIHTETRFPIYITHTKPAETEQIMEEVQRFDQTLPLGSNVSHDIRWLRAGQEFEL